MNKNNLKIAIKKAKIIKAFTLLFLNDDGCYVRVKKDSILNIIEYCPDNLVFNTELENDVLYIG